MTRIIYLAGPIAHWWDNESEPARFMSPEAMAYRAHRNVLSEWLVDHGLLVFRAHEAFKGDWDSRAQLINDYAVINSDVIIDMSPAGVKSPGTEREIYVAVGHATPVIHFSPGDNYSDLATMLDKTLQRVYTKTTSV